MGEANKITPTLDLQAGDFKFTEMEFKYNADSLYLSKVRAFFETLDVKRSIEVGSWDHYYTHSDDSSLFIRDRGGPGSIVRELTSKRKTKEQNNNVRKEIDLKKNSDINTYNEFLKMTGIEKGSILKEPSNAAIELKIDLDKVLEEARQRGYTFNFSIYKICWIYKLKNNTTVVYYIIYDNEFKEQGRFIEIEADKDYQWESEEQALNVVKDVEKKLTDEFGITAQNRLRQSLYEMFRKP
jgi:hypothetical protein